MTVVSYPFMQLTDKTFAWTHQTLCLSFIWEFPCYVLLKIFDKQVLCFHKQWIVTDAAEKMKKVIDKRQCFMYNNNRAMQQRCVTLHKLAEMQFGYGEILKRPKRRPC